MNFFDCQCPAYNCTEEVAKAVFSLPAPSCPNPQPRADTKLVSCLILMQILMFLAMFSSYVKSGLEFMVRRLDFLVSICMACWAALAVYVVMGHNERLDIRSDLFELLNEAGLT